MWGGGWGGGGGIFFFQAEDGIRGYDVTGVQTCALPICREPEHEQQRRAEDVKPGYRITAAGRAGATSDIGQVARHERQDAG